MLYWQAGVTLASPKYSLNNRLCRLCILVFLLWANRFVFGEFKKKIKRILIIIVIFLFVFASLSMCCGVCIRGRAACTRYNIALYAQRFHSSSRHWRCPGGASTRHRHTHCRLWRRAARLVGPRYGCRRLRHGYGRQTVSCLSYGLLHTLPPLLSSPIRFAFRRSDFPTLLFFPSLTSSSSFSYYYYHHHAYVGT